MLVLLFCAFSGFLISLIAHISLILGFSLPSDIIAIILNVGIVSSVCVRLYVVRDLRQSKEWFFDKSLKNICPHWLKVLTSLIVVTES